MRDKLQLAGAVAMVVVGLMAVYDLAQHAPGDPSPTSTDDASALAGVDGPELEADPTSPTGAGGTN